MTFFNQPERRKQGYKLALAATTLALCVVVLGAFTRLVDAGLGCPDWPGCYGQLLWPNDSEEIARANELYPDAPVETDKTWPEMVHRYSAGTLGLLIAGLAVIAWRNREQRGQPFRLPMFLLFLMVWQALFGMWTVTLKLWPQVVTLHLLGGMSIFSLLWLLYLRLDNRRWCISAAFRARLDRFKPWLITAIVVVAFQILLGGWMSSNYAAFACPDFPTCHNSWWPGAMDFRSGFDLLQRVGPNYSGGLLESDARTAIHMAHRVGAVVTTLFVAALMLGLVLQKDRSLTGLAILVLVALALQVALGVSNVLFMIPLSVAVLHNAGGALLLASLVLLATRVWMADTDTGT